jgi:hypothetical protein
MAATPVQFVRINYPNAALQKFTTRGFIKKVIMKKESMPA